MQSVRIHLRSVPHANPHTNSSGLPVSNHVLHRHTTYITRSASRVNLPVCSVNHRLNASHVHVDIYLTQVASQSVLCNITRISATVGAIHVKITVKHACPCQFVNHVYQEPIYITPCALLNVLLRHMSVLQVFVFHVYHHVLLVIIKRVVLRVLWGICLSCSRSSVSGSVKMVTLGRVPIRHVSNAQPCVKHATRKLTSVQVVRQAFS